MIIKIFLLTAILVLASNHYFGKQNKACFGNRCFKLELALTEKEKSAGLMFRKKLNPEEGMLFVFDKEGKYPFWMKNTLIPLDVIWINKDRKIVFISENSQPCEMLSCPVINPEKDAQYVLEINGGISEEIGLSVGDRADIFLSRKFLFGIGKD